LEQASHVNKGKRQETRVEQVMRKEIVKVLPGETGLDVFRKMSQHEIGRLVVVDPTNRSKLLGIVTKADLIETLLKPPTAK